MARKFTRRTSKPRRKMLRKGSRKARATRKMRGGLSGASSATGNTYTFTVATPISPTSSASNFPPALGTFSPANQQISFSNPSKSITDVHLLNGTNPYTGVATYGTVATTKVSIQIGSEKSLVPSNMTGTLNGTTKLGSTARTGPVTIKGLAAGSFGTLPSVLTFKVVTSN